MNKKIVIAFSGQKGSGKDTAAQQFINNDFDDIKFATPLKEMLYYLLDYARVPYYMAERYIDGDLKETPCPELNGVTLRHSMTTLGTEWAREMISPSLWVDLALRKIDASQNNVVITDLRFQNELVALKERGAITIRIERDQLGAANNHASEIGISNLKVDYSVKNDSDIRKLNERTMDCVEDYKIRLGWLNPAELEEVKLRNKIKQLESEVSDLRNQNNRLIGCE